MDKGMSELMKLAREFRKFIRCQMKATQKLVKQSDLTDEELKEIINIYDSWEVGMTIVKGEYYKYKDSLYKAIGDEHEAEEQFNPERANYLFTEISPKEVIPEWVGSTGYTDIKNKGDKIEYKGLIYICLVDKTAHNPDQAPRNWELIPE